MLPLIFARLADRPGHWFWALTAITGQNPVADEDLGNVRRMSEAWLTWAQPHLVKNADAPDANEYAADEALS